MQVCQAALAGTVPLLDQLGITDVIFVTHSDAVFGEFMRQCQSLVASSAKRQLFGQHMEKKDTGGGANAGPRSASCGATKVR